jgi:glycosyltransferase involved in cell wall biosynthesis
MRLTESRKQVCIDCRYIRERPSGIGVVNQALVDRIPNLAPDLDFLFLKHPKAPQRLSACSNVQEVVVPQEANGPATLFWLPRVFDFRSVDLYHCPFNLLPHGLRTKSVVTVCDVMWIKTPQWAQHRRLYRHIERLFYQHAIWNALRHADRLICISEATRNEVQSLDSKASARARVALEGVSNDFRQMSAEELSTRLEALRHRRILPNKRYVLTVGQYSAYKNHEGVVRAFALAFWDNPDIDLVLVQRLGNGSRILGDIAKSIGIADRVHVLQAIPFDDLVALYNGALALCHPSFVEGFGNPIAEAMACACPVVTSNRSAMPEVVNGAGLLVNPDNASSIATSLRRVAFDSEFRAERIELGLKRAKELSWDAFAHKTLDVYRETLALN